MAGKLIVTVDEDSNTTVESNLFGDDLYRAYVGLTCSLINQLEDLSDVYDTVSQAVNSAMNILKGKMN